MIKAAGFISSLLLCVLVSIWVVV